MATTKPFVSSTFNYETLEEKLDVKGKGESLCIGMPKENSFNENFFAITSAFTISFSPILFKESSFEWNCFPTIIVIGPLFPKIPNLFINFTLQSIILKIKCIFSKIA